MQRPVPTAATVIVPLKLSLNAGKQHFPE